MTPYEQMIKFEIGIEIGILSLSDLQEFLSQNLRELDVPYIYTDVFLSLPKGEEAVIETIFYNLRGKYIVDRSKDSNILRGLIGIIHDKFEHEEISLEQCVGFLYALTSYFECNWDLLAIGEHYRLTKSGYHSTEEFNDMLNRIFAQELK